MEGGSKKGKGGGRDAEKGCMTSELKELIKGELRKDKSVEEGRRVENEMPELIWKERERYDLKQKLRSQKASG